MKAVILVGGLGTRLRPLTCNTPKAMVPILNRPFMEHQLLYLKRHGITDVILAMGYLPDPIRDRLGDGAGLGVKLPYSVEDTPLGTSGAVKNAQSMLDGPFIVCRAALPALQSSGKATIVNVASGAGLQPRQNFSAYCASKGGLVLFTKAIAMDLAPDHIRVNAVCPGIVLTPLVERNLALTGDREAAYQRYISRNLMHRFGTAEEVADAVLFLSCEESSFITGSALSLDGGSVFH